MASRMHGRPKKTPRPSLSVVNRRRTPNGQKERQDAQVEPSPTYNRIANLVLTHERW